jgi:ATP-dependent DNA helicase RecQ
VLEHGHDSLKTFGVGRDRAPAQWRGVLRQLLSAKLIGHDAADRDRLILTEEGQKVLRGQAPFSLREDVVTKAARRRQAAPPPQNASATVLAALKALRTDIAKAQRQPAYVIFADRTLNEMAARLPQNLEELAAIHGVGVAKLQKYGPAFLAVIKDAADA